MHDINRTQLETGWGSGLAGESEYEDFESEFEDSEYEMYPETYGEAYGPLGEAEEMELAAQLLEVTDEQELNYFLGKLFKKVKKAVGRVVPASILNPLGGIAKNLAKKLLPVAGNFIMPGVGGIIGGKLASMATEVFGLELEGLSAEDQEFEIARSYVRLVSDAAQEAANIPPTVPPQAAAQQAMQTAVETHPGAGRRTDLKPLQAVQERVCVRK